MQFENKDFKKFPKFRHNLWTTYDDNPAITYLAVSHGTYEVATEDANRFLQIRSYCTGHNDISTISEKSNVSKEEVELILNSLIDIDMLHLPYKLMDSLTKQEIIQTLQAASKIWSEQLAETHISREIFLGKTSKNIVIGWLLETYHYVKQFPVALEIAASHAQGQLKDLLIEYANQEKGHEEFILRSLVKAGLSRQEVESSIPLVSTRIIDLLLRELFSYEPSAVLLIASIIESEDFDMSSAQAISQLLHDVHGFSVDMLYPFFQHVEIDSKCGHHQLLQNNIMLMEKMNPLNLHDVINKIHDIKHAFDLQRLEIKDYYGKNGNYLPRQYVDYFAI